VVDPVGWYPDIGCMAILADVGGLDVSRVLARGIGAVVATGAIACDVDVIEIGGQPASGRMTVFAIVAT